MGGSIKVIIDSVFNILILCCIVTQSKVLPDHNMLGSLASSGYPPLKNKKENSSTKKAYVKRANADSNF